MTNFLILDVGDKLVNTDDTALMKYEKKFMQKAGSIFKHFQTKNQRLVLFPNQALAISYIARQHIVFILEAFGEIRRSRETYIVSNF